MLSPASSKLSRMRFKRKSHCRHQGHLHRWAAVLNVAAFPDGFGLFTTIAKVAMN